MKIPFFGEKKKKTPGGVKSSRHVSQSDEPASYPVENLSVLGEGFVNSICSLYDAEPQEGIDGTLYEIDAVTKISKVQGMTIYDLYLELQPRTSIEIGLAYGYSTLFILSAIKRLGKGHHTAIDPYQTSTWHGIGLNHARKHAPSIEGKSTFSLIEDRSDAALIDLKRSGESFDFIYIDGNHRFDDVIVDFYLAAQLCAVGGYIILDDMWMSSIKTAVDFFRTNRTDFDEMPARYHNIAVFRKISEDERPWNEFFPFKVL